MVVKKEDVDVYINEKLDKNEHELLISAVNKLRKEQSNRGLSKEVKIPITKEDLAKILTEDECKVIAKCVINFINILE